MKFKPLDRPSIIMRADDADKWLSALRSGKYKQGFAALRQVDGTALYCVYGVLMMALDGKITDTEIVDGKVYGITSPSDEWFINHHMKTEYESFDPMSFIIGYSDTGHPVNPSFMNDCLRFDFNKMARILNKAIKRI